MPRSSRTSILVLALLVAWACDRSARPKQVEVAAPSPPSFVIGVASGVPITAVERARQYVESVRPGFGVQLTLDAAMRVVAQAVGAHSLDGADLNKSAHILILNPKGHPKPVVVAVAVSDAAKLDKAKGNATVRIQNGYALLGDKASIDLVASYVFTTLVAQTAPIDPTVTFFARPILDTYRGEIESVRKQMSAAMAMQGGAMAKVLDAELGLLLSLGDQTDRVMVALAAEHQTATMDLGIVPRNGTPFAAFCKAQRPFDAALIQRLPVPDGMSMVMAGHVELGPLRTKVVHVVAELFASVPGVQLDDALRGRIEAFLNVLDGGFAATFRTAADGRAEMAEVIGVEDGARAMELLRQLYAPFSDGKPKRLQFMGLAFDLTWRADVSKHDGVAISQAIATFDMSSFPEPQRANMKKLYGDGMSMYFAGFDRTLAMTMGPSGYSSMTAIIDTMRGKSRPTLRAAIGESLAEGKRRQESIVMFMDMVEAIRTAMPGPVAAAKGPSASGVAFAFGFADGAAHMRISIPAAHVREIMGMVGGAPTP